MHFLFPAIVKRYSNIANEPESGPQGLIITGCSSGIGKAAALHLVQHQKVTVFATVRRQEDLHHLQSEYDSMSKPRGQLIPIVADVCKSDSLQLARQKVEEYLLQHPKSQLIGVVNNAGVGFAGPVEMLPDSAVQTVFQTNVFGLLKMSQLFLPLLRQYRGSRLVNISSVAGDISMASNGIYCSSKHAVQALSESLRQELLPLDVAVSVVQPGCVRTEIFRKTSFQKQKTMHQLPAAVRQTYNDAYGWLIKPDLALMQTMESFGVDTALTSVTIEHALFSPYPQHYYLVGPDAVLSYYLHKLLPSRLWDFIMVTLLKHAGQTASDSPSNVNSVKFKSKQ